MQLVDIKLDTCLHMFMPENPASLINGASSASAMEHVIPMIYLETAANV
jgi:hypothetical protein